MKNVVNLKTIIYTFLLLLFVVCSEDEPIQYQLTTLVYPPESGSISPSSGIFEEGSAITLTAIPAASYTFKNWSGGTTGNENPISIVFNTDKTITAVFEKKNYSLNITIVGEGTVNEEIIQAKSATDYPSGTIVNLTAIPSNEWEFVEWNGNYQGTENPIQITINEQINLTAKFEKKNYPLNITIVGEGIVNEEIIQAKSATDYPSGTIIKLTAIPSEGWVFDKWNGHYEGNENPIDITIDNLTSITAKFLDTSPKTYVPDDNFEQALIDLGYDNVLDDYVNTDIIESITNLNVESKNISDLTGIENFVSLTDLYCQDNQINSLDVSNIPDLFMFFYSNNPLTCIQVSQEQLNRLEIQWPNNLWWFGDEGVSYSLDCNYQ